MNVTHKNAVKYDFAGKTELRPDAIFNANLLDEDIIKQHWGKGKILNATKYRFEL